MSWDFCEEVKRIIMSLPNTEKSFLGTGQVLVILGPFFPTIARGSCCVPRAGRGAVRGRGSKAMIQAEFQNGTGSSIGSHTML